MAKQATPRSPATRQTPARRAKVAPTRRAKQQVADAAAAPPAAAPAAAPASLKVRMYRQGLGDCFLVTLPKEDGSPFYLMIDCGVILGTKEPGKIMAKVVQNIIEVTKGHVDLLCVTHEHWDHLSGFIQAQELFSPAHEGKQPGKLSIDTVWFAWTENPSDALANQLRQERADRVQKLAAFVAGKAANGDNQQAQALVDGVNEVLSFFGVDAKAQTANSTGAALDFVRQLATTIRYCQPSDPPAPLPSVAAVRTYVLGPPHDESALRKTDSTTEVYQALADLGAASSFFAAHAYKMAAGDDMANPQLQSEFDRHNPFDPSYGRDLDDLKKLCGDPAKPNDMIAEFFDRYYFGRSEEPFTPDQAWRRIDGDWMGAAAEFALQLDSATNNTSLVLAIELVGSNKVLLFAADAQVGNWLSWQGLSWKLTADTTVTGPDLLKRTVFYKVGHHGSHNATLKSKGIEMMQSDELVAFIPVNHAMALVKHWGNMPLPGIVTALKEKAKERVVRIDENYTAPAGNAAAARFAEKLETNELFYEWTMPLS